MNLWSSLSKSALFIGVCGGQRHLRGRPAVFLGSEEADTVPAIGNETKKETAHKIL